MEGMSRNFKTSKFKTIAKHAISRLEYLKTRHLARCSVSLSDVLQLLNLGQHEKALDRVEMVIKEHDMLDAFDMIEGYCVLLVEIIDLVQHESTLPKAVKEAISSLIYAATRCGEFPELQDFRLIFTSWCGKEFVKSAAGLRHDCGVNPKIIQKLSTRMTSLDNRVKVLKKIAAENKIVLQLRDTGLEISEEKIVESVTYVPDAAVVTTVESNQPDSHDPDDSNRFTKPTRGNLMKSKLGKNGEKKDVKGIMDLEVKIVSYRIHQLQLCSSEPLAAEEEKEDDNEEEEEVFNDDTVQRLKKAALYRKKLAAKRAESVHKTISETKTAPDEDLSVEIVERTIDFDESRDEKQRKSSENVLENHGL